MSLIKFIGSLILLLVLWGISDMVIELFLPIHAFFNAFAYLVTRPFRWGWKKLLTLLPNKKSKLYKGSTGGMWGGKASVITVLIMLLISAALILFLLSTSEDAEEILVEKLLLGTPLFYSVSLGLDIILNKFSLLTVASAMRKAITSAIIMAFYHRKENCKKWVRFLYGLVFTLFFTLTFHFVPSELFLLPAAVWEWFVSICGPYALTALPLKILLTPLFIAGVLLALNILLAVFAVSIRELVASLLFSLPASLAVGLILLPALADLMAGTSDTFQLVVIILLTILVSAIVSLIRSDTEDDKDSFCKHEEPWLVWKPKEIRDKRRNKAKR